MTQTEKKLRQQAPTGVNGEKYTLQGHVATTDATSTTAVAVPVTEKMVLHLNIMGVGTRDDFTDSLVIFEQSGWRRASGGNVAAFGSANRFESHDSGGAPTVLASADTVNQTIDINVAGIAAQNWQWHITIEVVELILP